MFSRSLDPEDKSKAPESVSETLTNEGSPRSLESCKEETEKFPLGTCTSFEQSNKCGWLSNWYQKSINNYFMKESR